MLLRSRRLTILVLLALVTLSNHCSHVAASADDALAASTLFDQPSSEQTQASAHEDSTLLKEREDTSADTDEQVNLASSFNDQQQQSQNDTSDALDEEGRAIAGEQQSGSGNSSVAAAAADGRRVSCAEPERPYERLLLLNASQINALVGQQPARNECTLLVFYSPHCMFSARAAPHLNGIARHYPRLAVAALQINESSSVNMKYGIVAVPTVMLLHNARAIAKLNHTNTSLDSLAAFIEKHTGMPKVEGMELLDADREGPLPCQVVPRPSWLLAAAWLFTFLASLYLLARSALAAKTYNWLAATWREAREAEQQQQQQQQRPHQD